MQHRRWGDFVPATPGLHPLQLVQGSIQAALEGTLIPAELRERVGAGGIPDQPQRQRVAIMARRQELGLGLIRSESNDPASKRPTRRSLQ